MKHRLLAATMICTLALLLIQPQIASAKVLKKKTGHGQYAVATVGANVSHPHRLIVKVTSVPHQKVLVSWDTVCSQGLSAGSKSGQFTAQSPVRRKVKHPYHHPDSCTFSASAQLQEGGNKITVFLLAT